MKEKETWESLLLDTELETRVFQKVKLRIRKEKQKLRWQISIISLILILGFSFGIQTLETNAIESELGSEIHSWEPLVLLESDQD